MIADWFADANEEYQRPGFPAPATQPNALRRKTGI